MRISTIRNSIVLLLASLLLACQGPEPVIEENTERPEPESPAPKIALTPVSAHWGYAGGEGLLSFDIINPLSSDDFLIYSTCHWITITDKTNNSVAYTVSENNSGAEREGAIVIEYGESASNSFSVTQAWAASEIILSDNVAYFEYSDGNGSFTFDIKNPRNGAEVSVSCVHNWITDIDLTDNSICFSVEENNSGDMREGKIVIRYGSYAVAKFTVNQDWSRSYIEITPRYVELGYEGGSVEFNYEIRNPRKSATLKVKSNADWINDITISDSSITCQVQENLSGERRTGFLGLEYGPWANYAFFDIIQNEY